MKAKLIQLLVGIGVLCFSLPPAVAFATPEEEMVKADKSFNGEDIKEASRILKSLADQNYLPAQVRLGEFMHSSDDDEEAFGWFLTAAVQGDAAAQFHLSDMYANGFGIEKNLEKALFWLKKSGNQNFLTSVQALAEAYKTPPDGKENPNAKSLGVTPDKAQEEFWSAKLPALEKEAAKKLKKINAARDKEILEMRKAAAEKAKAEQSKLLCGLKC